MSTTTNIQFENENRVYYSGEVIKGRATLTLNEEKIVRGIYVRIYGVGHCEWNHSEHNKRAHWNWKAEGNETYIDERIYFVGSPDSESGDVAVAAGTYTYTFECQLPVEIPSSLEMKHGSIKYIANLVLDRPSWQIPTPDFPFTVIKPLELSTDFTIHEPLTKEIEHRFNVCCLICCWESKPFRMVVTLPKSGFVPNEVIDIDVDLKNPSTEHISGIWVYIIRKMEAHANDGNSDSEKKDTELIFKMLDGVRNGNDKRVKGQIVVPDVPPTDTTTSTIFKVSYIMRFMAFPGLCHENVIMEIPIKIGTDNARESNTLPTTSTLDPRPISSQPTGSVSTQPAILGKANPPTYEEAIKSPPPPKGKK